MRRKRKLKRWRSWFSELDLNEARLWLNRHAAIIGIVAAVLLIVSVLSMWRPGGGNTTPEWTREYYYDLNTGRLFEADMKNAPPIEAPSGSHEGRPAGMLAYVFTCGKCTEAEWQVGFLENHTDDAKLASGEINVSSGPGFGDPRLFSRLAQGILVKRPEDPDWVPKSSPEGQMLIREAMNCGQGPAKRCRP